MNLKNIHSIYFLGIGGIGMSALARYFNHTGKTVLGYDKVETKLTKNLVLEGINIHYADDINIISKDISNKNTIVIYTPAIPSNHSELNFFKQNDYKIYKRAEILGLITDNYKTVAVAGTHGKTSISTTTAHIINKSSFNSLAFLGGIAKNYSSNLILPQNNDNETIAVAEADEYDRSFLQLNPYIALISSIDADHLDIYGNKKNLVDTFNQFINKINKKGILVYKKGLELNKNLFPNKAYTYSFENKADFYATNISINKKGQYCFDLITPFGTMKNFTSGTPGKINAENAVASITLAHLLGLDEETIKENLEKFEGVERRFDFQINTEHLIYVDDYAHHPAELDAFIDSMKTLFKGKKITGIFQPHLFSRTKDFADEFANSLCLLDELILLDIYPAREKPIEGVTSKIIFDKVKLKTKTMCKLDDIVEVLKNKKLEVLLTMGAGNIDKKVKAIKNSLE